MVTAGSSGLVTLSGGKSPQYAVQMVFGGAFGIGISVTADLVPPQGQKYRALLGCDVLVVCRLTYEGPRYGFPRRGRWRVHAPCS